MSFPARKESFEGLTLKINTLEFTNILIGEVWICSGQSNMGFDLSKIQGAKSMKVDNPNLRLCF